MRKYFFSLCFISLLIACYKDNEETLYPATDCDVSAVSFSQDIQPLINSTCNTPGCHNQGGNGNGIFENYQQIKAKVDNGSMRQRVVIDRDMPPGTSLSECQILFFKTWLDNGAPNN